MRGGVLLYAAQGNPKIDAEIAEKRRFRTGTSRGERPPPGPRERGSRPPSETGSGCWRFLPFGFRSRSRVCPLLTCENSTLAQHLNRIGETPIHWRRLTVHPHNSRRFGSLDAQSRQFQGRLWQKKGTKNSQFSIAALNQFLVLSFQFLVTDAVPWISWVSGCDHRGSSKRGEGAFIGGAWHPLGKRDGKRVSSKSATPRRDVTATTRTGIKN